MRPTLHPQPSSGRGTPSHPEPPRPRLAAALAATLLATLGVVPAAGTQPAAIDVPPGSELRSRPSWNAPVVAVLAGGELRLLAVGMAPWVEVEGPKARGWLNRSDPASWPASSAAALARARRALGQAAAEPRRLGEFAAASDVPSGRTWRFFDRLAAAVPAEYRRRYGLPSDRPPTLREESVILFAHEAAFRQAVTNKAHRAGQAGEGFAMLYLGERSRSEAGSTLVHELTHLLNRRSLGHEIPLWLDEGLAEDMSLLRIGTGGSLGSGRLDARSLRVAGGRRLYGPLLHLPQLVARASGGELWSGAELRSLGRDEFEASPNRQLLYALFGLWVNYLLEDDELAPAFRHYLAERATGAAPDFALSRDEEELERGFRRWLTDLPRRLGIDQTGS